jgi:hypothetical protein
MELYQDKIRDFLKYFPKELLASKNKTGGYEVTPRFQALRDCDYIRYNSDERISIIAVDIDHHQDGGVWMDHDMPQPTWVIYTDRGVQFMWVLEKPILANIRKHREYAKDVLRKIVYTLDADKSAMSYTRVFRNPLRHRTHFSNSRVSLKDFDMLKSPPVEWLDSVSPEKAYKNLFNDKIADTVEFERMKQGDGRNVALFDRLRYWAYAEAKAGTYEEFNLAERAFKLNQKFAEPMDYKEVDRIITSIDWFIENKYNQGGYMAKTTPEERSKIASANGKKGGKVRGKLQTIEARGRILAALNRLEMFEMKITISGVARMAKSDKRTVSSYLKELGYTNKGGSVGWKK